MVYIIVTSVRKFCDYQLKETKTKDVITTTGGTAVKQVIG